MANCVTIKTTDNKMDKANEITAGVINRFMTM
jgi:hypothetical protein